MDKNEAVQAIKRTHYEVEDASYRLKKAVVEASMAGASWAEIAEVIGTSKQTAYNRYRQDVSQEERGRKWAAENPEKHAAAVAAGVAKAQADLAEIRAGRTTKKIECTHCSWTVAYPANEEDEAYMDFEDHMNTTHEDDAYREDAINEENAARMLIEVPATDPETWDQGDRKHFATPMEGRPDKCAYCGTKHHKHGKNTWIYRGCTPTTTDPVFTLITGITVGTTAKDAK